MKTSYKAVLNGKGTELTISENCQITFGPNGRDIQIKCNHEALGFDSFEDMVASMTKSKATYYRNDKNLKSQNVDVIDEKEIE